jgi:hypothetical protein
LPGCFRNGRQVYDYYTRDRKSATVQTNQANIPSLIVYGQGVKDKEQTWIKSTSPKFSIRNPSGNFMGHHALFIEGDVFIEDDIAYADSPWSNISQIPNFRLIVKGDIYISRNVTQLDGLYVAQPIDATNGGKIYTCANNVDGNLYSQTNLYDFCRQRSDGQPNKLEVNGSFIAQDISFLRTIYSLGDVLASCPFPTMRGENFGCDHAAESFRLSPDFFLGLPASQPTGGQNNGKYDSIKTLPPLL